MFAADAANALAKATSQQNMEFRFSASKDAADWLADRLTEQRRALEASEAALQAYKEKNGAVSVADSASNIVVQRLTDLNGALTKAKTERINKEALYNQLKSAEGTRRARHVSGGARERLHPEAEDGSRPTCSAQQAQLARALRRAPPGDDQDRGRRSRPPTPSCAASSARSSSR